MTKFARYCDLAVMSGIMSSVNSVIGQVKEKNTQIQNRSCERYRLLEFLWILTHQ